MLYFLYQSYVPNVASTNRSLAYIRNIEKLKIPTTVVYFLPDKDYSKIEEVFHYVEIKYYWEYFYFNNKILKYLLYYIYLKQFAHQLKEGDEVYVYGYNDICKEMLRKKGVKVFFEVTECPEISLPSSPFYHISLEHHYNICKKVAALFVISANLKEFYISKGIDGKLIHVINMIVDPNRFDHLKQEHPHDNYIAYCGSATNNKDGVDKLIKAFAIVSKKYTSIKLYIIGPAPYKGDQGNNQELVNQLGLKDKIVFTGTLSSNQIPQMLKNACLLALNRPNNKQAKYGFPTKLGEYLLSGTPVVITNVGNIPLFLKDGVSALIVPPNDPTAFANKLCWVLAHPKESQVIGEKGKHVALTSFNAYTETLKLVEIIKNV